MPLVNKQKAIWTISGIATVVAGVIAVQTWAEDNFVTQDQSLMYRAEQKVLHDKQYLSRMLDYTETKLELTQIRADRLRELKHPSAREMRELERLEEDISYYTEELRKIKNRLRLGE